MANEYSSKSWTLLVTADVELIEMAHTEDNTYSMTEIYGEMQKGRAEQVKDAKFPCGFMQIGGVRDLIVTGAAYTHPWLFCFLASSVPTPIRISNDVCGVREPEIYWAGAYW